MDPTGDDAISNVYPPLRWGLGQLAGFCGVSNRTVQRFVKLGLLPRPFRMGRKCVWMSDQVIEFIQQRCKDAQATAAAKNLENFEAPGRRGQRNSNGK